MVEMRLRRIRHKQERLHYWAVCGVYGESAVIHKSWRWVTCKRCLRSKPKKS